jgi:uncharacterized Zn-binding protein involved in type VI secretion
MGEPAAKQGDRITATDMHFITTSSGQTTLMPFTFDGPITGQLSDDVRIMEQPAAMQNSTANNTPPHIPPPGSTFKSQPSNRGEVVTGSKTVLINGKPAARNGDPAQTCTDQGGPPAGTVVATGTVLIG